MHYQRKLITEEEIERAVERQINAADRALLRGTIPQNVYDQLIKDIDTWAKEQRRYV